MMNKIDPDQKYRCPHCGKVVEGSEIIDDRIDGGWGMCPCEWTSESRVYNEYVLFNEHILPLLTNMKLTEDEVNIILAIRATRE